MITAILNALDELTTHKEIVLLSNSVLAKPFADKHPTEYIHCASAQLMAHLAEGLSDAGKTTFILTEDKLHLEHLIANNPNIKVISRQAVGNTNIFPADSIQAAKATIASGLTNGLVSIHFHDEKETITKAPFSLGKTETLKEGKDCTILANGKDLHAALKAAEKLSVQDINCTVINIHTLPLQQHLTIPTHGVVVVNKDLAGQFPHLGAHVSSGTAEDIVYTVKQHLLERFTRNKPKELHPQHHLKLANKTITSLEQLKHELSTMPIDIFHDNKNSILEWTGRVEDNALADAIAKRTTPFSAALEVEHWQ